ncbi:hypothetical protein [Cohnella boryungensis]|uniref:Spore coat protein B n=1 Tax=Cohnella boryungensis TaxID=768479 RepID=A0ABV8SH41_9BACL
MFHSFQPQSGHQSAKPHPRTHTNVLHASHLVGRSIRVNRGGHDSVAGILVAIPGDYLVIHSDSVMVYVNGTHVKSITEGSRSGGHSGGKSGGSGGRTGGSRTHGVHKSHISAPSFQSLLSRLRHKHIQINRGGHEKLDGFLAEISSDNVLLIVDRELVRIPIFHIKNVGVSKKNNNKSSNQNKNQSGSKNQSGGKNKSESKNHSGGKNKSGCKNKSGSKSQSGGKNKSGGNKSGSKSRSGGQQNKSKGNGRR